MSVAIIQSKVPVVVNGRVFYPEQRVPSKDFIQVEEAMRYFESRIFSALGVPMGLLGSRSDGVWGVGVTFEK